MTLVGPSGESPNETHTHTRKKRKERKYKLTHIPPPRDHWLALETGFDQPNHLAKILLTCEKQTKLLITSVSCVVEKRLSFIEAPGEVLKE